MRSLFFLAMALCAAVSFAQHTTLPHALDRAEVPLIPAYRDSRAGATRGISQPPAFPVRTMAEWEEVQALVITWTSFTGILKQIVRHAKEECQVIIVCSKVLSPEEWIIRTVHLGIHPPQRSRCKGTAPLPWP